MSEYEPVNGGGINAFDSAISKISDTGGATIIGGGATGGVIIAEGIGGNVGGNGGVGDGGGGGGDGDGEAGGEGVGDFGGGGDGGGSSTVVDFSVNFGFALFLLFNGFDVDDCGSADVSELVDPDRK